MINKRLDYVMHVEGTDFKQWFNGVEGNHDVWLQLSVQLLSLPFITPQPETLIS